MAFTVQGDYWHSLPQRRQRDAKKATIAAQYGFKVIYIWEHEIYTSIDLVKNRLEYHLLNKKLFNFKTCKIMAMPFKECVSLLEKHHYQGSGRAGSTCVAAIYKDEVIAVCIFGSVTRKEIADKQNISTHHVRELMRLCINPKYQTKNFSSWFVAKSRRLLKIREPEIKLLVSFADPNFGHVGVVYLADNWRMDGLSTPSYWYVNNRKCIIHKKTIWNRAKKVGITEAQLVQKDKLIKVESRPKIRYLRKP